MGTDLVIPARPSTEIATGFNLEVRRQLQAVEDIDAIMEGRRQLAAWQSYVTKREQKRELQAADRWCEVRIGELLGEAERGRPTKEKLPAGNISGAQRQDFHKFRLMAANKALVAKLIEGGQVSRGQLLKAIKDVTRPEPDPEIAGRVGERIVGGLAELAGESFGCIYADPPWKYGNQSTRAATDNHYSTMSVDELCEMPVSSVVAESAHLHLWTTNAFLFDARLVMEAWGFEYRSCFIWVKPQMGIGNYWRVSHEFLLLGIRGDAKRFNCRNLKSWGQYSRGRHSKKPEEVRGFIEQASDGPYLEMFGREGVTGWTVLGNQVAPQRRLA